MQIRNTHLWTLAGGFALAMTAGQATAAVIWVDNNSRIANTDAKWNVFDAPTATATAVVDADGNDDGVTVSYSGINDSTSTTNHNGAFATTVWDPGAADYFAVSNGNTGTVTIAGLLDSETYTVRLVGSVINDADPRIGDFQVNGAFGDALPNNGDDYNAHIDGFDNGEVMTWTGVAPVSGVITITVEEDTNTVGNAFFNAFSIEGNFVPEPGSLALLGLGGLCLLKRRRRHA